MMLPIRKVPNQTRREERRFPTRLPNPEIYSSSILHHYFVSLSRMYRELESENSIEGVIHNRKRFLALYSDMVQEKVPFMDFDSIALLRGATAIKTEHRGKCLCLLANLKHVTMDKINPNLDGSVDRVPTAGESSQARRELKQHYTYILRNWVEAHSTYPFPTKVEKTELCRRASITERQLNNWFTNYRRRHQHLVK